MSVRTVGASPLYRIPQLAYHWMGAATAPLRLHPAFIMIGAQRCGTTSLFRALVAHPQVMSPAFRKGINYFDLNYFRGERWYTGHFPISEIPGATRPVTASRWPSKRAATTCTTPSRWS